MKQLKVLLVGVGTVGRGDRQARRRAPWLDRWSWRTTTWSGRASSRRDSAEVPRTRRRRPGSPSAFVDAGKPELVTQLAREHGVDIVVNAADPRFVPTIFDGAFAAGVDYLDMAVSLSEPHPTEPVSRSPASSSATTSSRSTRRGRPPAGWRSWASGWIPGLTDLFAAYARKHLFDEIDEVHVRDGGDLYIEGYAFAPSSASGRRSRSASTRRSSGTRRAAATTRPSRSPASRPSSSRRGSARWSASTSSTRRSSSSRAGSPASRRRPSSTPSAPTSSTSSRSSTPSASTRRSRSR